MNNIRYFRHVNGFGGITKILAFFEDGEVWGYDEDGAVTNVDFGGLYNIEFALDRTKLGIWEEVENPELLKN